jgi:DMSO/TMAO reductase YedYZ molybdopterin-dependent catalytic subunit
MAGIPIEFITGLLSYVAYDPRLPGNNPNPAAGVFGRVAFNWFTSPPWLYRLIEGIHVFLGLALIPVVIVKLWSVIPQLFTWPPLRSVAQFLERLTLAMLVGGIFFEITSGILNIDYFDFAGFDFYSNFYTGHFYGAWMLMAAFVVHVALRLGKVRRTLKARPIRAELRTGLAATTSEPPDDALVAINPAPPTISRRGVLALVGGTSLVVLLLTAGETIGGALRRVAWFGTRNAAPGIGPNHFPVNHTAAAQGITAALTGPGWRIEVVGAKTVSLSRDDLLAMALVTAELPITCTEGWSTTQSWTGVRLSDLAGLAGITSMGPALLETLDDNAVWLSSAQVRASKSMLALRVNDADLSLDHGYPARIIVPATPGTHNKKWMRRITFEEA